MARLGNEQNENHCSTHSSVVLVSYNTIFTAACIN